MFRKFGVALLIGVFLPIGSKAEVLGIKPSQRFYSAQLGLQTGKWRLFNNELGINEESGGAYNGGNEHSRAGVGTYIAESFGGLAGGVVGAIPSAYFTMCWVCALCMEDYEGAGKALFFAGITYFVGVPLGAAYGTALAGKWLHQESSFVNAFKGALLGGLIGEGLLATACMLTGNDIDANVVFSIGGLIVYGLGSISGSVVGYDVFDKGEK